MVNEKNIALKAEEVLKSYYNGIFPIDPIIIARNAGLKVYTKILAPNISGQIFYKEKKIIIEKTDYFTRQIFSVAHELGHFFLHNDNTSHASLRDKIAEQGTDKKEIEANIFAANLLMPKDEVIKRIGDGFKLDSLASYFNVSSLAMEYRLINLGLKAYV